MTYLWPNMTFMKRLVNIISYELSVQLAQLDKKSIASLKQKCIVFTE